MSGIMYLYWPLYLKLLATLQSKESLFLADCVLFAPIAQSWAP